MRNLGDKTRKERKVEVQLRQTKRSIYTNEMLDEIRFMTEHHELKRAELITILRKRYADKKITDGNLNNVISRYDIHLKSSARGRYSSAVELNLDLINTLIKNPRFIADDSIDDSENTVEPDIEVVSEEVEQNIAEPDTVLYNEDNNIRPINELTEPTRFEPIRDEVHSVFSNWFKDKKCSIERDFQTQDYINMLDNLIYLAENVDYIIKARCDQHDIANCYQSDVLHEQENVVLEDGNTYLSDKMHVIRNCRRFIEYDSNNMNAMRGVLQSINVGEFKKVLAILQKYEENRKHPVFIPMIDKDMINKYEWAIEGSAEYGKLAKRPILVTNNKARNNSYKVSTNASKSSRIYYKAFKISASLQDATEEFNWQRRYYASTDVDAKAKATFDIKKQFSDVKILNLECTPE